MSLMTMSAVSFSRRMMIVAATLAGSAFATPSAEAASPFANFAGSWKGGGTVTVSGGREAIRCRVGYTPGDGNSLGIDVTCASDSYRIRIVSSIVVQGNSFTGSWQETTRQISGNVSGVVPEPNTYQASLQTMGGGIQIGARTNGKRQAITITSQGSDIQGANITLKKH